MTQRIRICASQGGNVFEGTRLGTTLGTWEKCQVRQKNVTSLLRPLLVASSLSPLPLPSSPSPSSPPPSLPSSWFCAQAPVPVAVLRRYASRLQVSEVDASREIRLVLGCDNRQSYAAACQSVNFPPPPPLFSLSFSVFSNEIKVQSVPGRDRFFGDLVP